MPRVRKIGDDMKQKHGLFALTVLGIVALGYRAAVAEFRNISPENYYVRTVNEAKSEGFKVPHFVDNPRGSVETYRKPVFLDFNLSGDGYVEVRAIDRERSIYSFCFISSNDRKGLQKLAAIKERMEKAKGGYLTTYSWSPSTDFKSLSYDWSNQQPAIYQIAGTSEPCKILERLE